MKYYYQTIQPLSPQHSNVFMKQSIPQSPPFYSPNNNNIHKKMKSEQNLNQLLSNTPNNQQNIFQKGIQQIQKNKTPGNVSNFKQTVHSQQQIYTDPGMYINPVNEYMKQKLSDTTSPRTPRTSYSLSNTQMQHIQYRAQSDMRQSKKSNPSFMQKQENLETEFQMKSLPNSEKKPIQQPQKNERKLEKKEEKKDEKKIEKKEEKKVEKKEDKKEQIKEDKKEEKQKEKNDEKKIEKKEQKVEKKHEKKVETKKPELIEFELSKKTKEKALQKLQEIKNEDNTKKETSKLQEKKTEEIKNKDKQISQAIKQLTEKAMKGLQKNDKNCNNNELKKLIQSKDYKVEEKQTNKLKKTHKKNKMSQDFIKQINSQKSTDINLIQKLQENKENSCSQFFSLRKSTSEKLQTDLFRNEFEDNNTEEALEEITNSKQNIEENFNSARGELNGKIQTQKLILEAKFLKLQNYLRQWQQIKNDKINENTTETSETSRDKYENDLIIYKNLIEDKNQYLQIVLQKYKIEFQEKELIKAKNDEEKQRREEELKNLCEKAIKNYDCINKHYETNIKLYQDKENLNTINNQQLVQ